MDKNLWIRTCWIRTSWLITCSIKTRGLLINDFVIVNLISSGSYFILFFPGFLPGDLQNRYLQIPRLEKGLELKGETPLANDPAIKVS